MHYTLILNKQVKATTEQDSRRKAVKRFRAFLTTVSDKVRWFEVIPGKPETESLVLK